MRSRSRWLVLTGLLAVTVPLVASAQPESGAVRVLVVDETKTLASTMRVAGLVGALRSIGAFEVGVALADVATSYDDPLAGRFPAEGEAPYDLILILPRGLDEGSINRIWIVSAGLSSLTPAVAASLGVLAGTVDLVFAGVGRTIDVSEDLWPCLLWSAYSMNGSIR